MNKVELMQLFNKYIFPVLFILIIYSCGTPEGNYPGTEFMPDMGHSIAYEANLYDYYYYNTWGGEEEYYSFAQPRTPVSNTIARGYAGIGAADHVRAAAMQGYEMNGSVPYPYSDTEPDRLRASRDIITNPYPITEEGMSRAKELYEVSCGICHGNKGDGDGYLISEENPYAVYPAQPAILTNDTFTYATNGRLYHAIMYGKNVMGGYADKLSYEERWQVIHYIRGLQAKNKNLTYNEEENTLNKDALPYEAWKAAYDVSDEDHIGEVDTDEHGPHGEEADHNDSDEHGHH